VYFQAIVGGAGAPGGRADAAGAAGPASLTTGPAAACRAHPAVTSSAALVGQRAGALRASTWHCPDSGRLFHAFAWGPDAASATTAIDRFLAGTDCHRERLPPPPAHAVRLSLAPGWTRGKSLASAHGYIGPGRELEVVVEEGVPGSAPADLDSVVAEPALAALLVSGVLGGKAAVEAVTVRRLTAGGGEHAALRLTGRERAGRPGRAPLHVETTLWRCPLIGRLISVSGVSPDPAAFARHRAVLDSARCHDPGDQRAAGAAPEAPPRAPGAPGAAAAAAVPGRESHSARMRIRSATIPSRSTATAVAVPESDRSTRSAR
jgi:hypothetical protein